MVGSSIRAKQAHCGLYNVSGVNLSLKKCSSVFKSFYRDFYIASKPFHCWNCFSLVSKIIEWNLPCIAKWNELSLNKTKWRFCPYAK